MTQLTFHRTSRLEIACEHDGPVDALPVVLLHGFPYDPRCFDDVVPILTARGLRTIVPWLRGYGGTRFRSPETMRSGQQAALAHDLVELLDVLDLRQALLAGFDWGARAACIVSALWPERVRGLVSVCGYQIQDIPGAAMPATAELERRFWYQYYFHTERGRAGLAAARAAFCRLLWQLWSPTWAFDEAVYQRTVASFDNSDFVDVVIHSYRHRFGYAPGDSHYETTEARLAMLPEIRVPTITLHGTEDGVMPAMLSGSHGKYFTGPYARRLLDGVGHNPPLEAPEAFAQAVLDLLDA